jgi:hypothetical protein
LAVCRCRPGPSPCTARVIVAAHAFVQNLRRSFYDLGTEAPTGRRLADAFAELAMVI